MTLQAVNMTDYRRIYLLGMIGFFFANLVGYKGIRRVVDRIDVFREGGESLRRTDLYWRFIVSAIPKLSGNRGKEFFRPAVFFLAEKRRADV